MKLEQALKLKKGAVVVAERNLPELTRGKRYTLQKDAEPVYLRAIAGCAAPRQESEESHPVNARLTVINDIGKLTEQIYSFFEISR